MNIILRFSNVTMEFRLDVSKPATPTPRSTNVVKRGAVLPAIKVQTSVGRPKKATTAQKKG